MGAIQDQIASLRTAFVPSAQSTASSSSTAASQTTGGASATGSTSFSSALQSALGGSTPATSLSSSAAVSTTGTTALPARASTLLTSDQQQFASRLAARTGLDPGVVSAWLLAEESGSAASSRQAQSNNDWLNIGYTDSGTYGSSDGVWSNPVSAADATAGWLKGQDTIPGYGTASSGIQGILHTAGQSPTAQISALQNSGWASSGYPSLNSLYGEVAG